MIVLGHVSSSRTVDRVLAMQSAKVDKAYLSRPILAGDGSTLVLTEVGLENVNPGFIVFNIKQ